MKNFIIVIVCVFSLLLIGCQSKNRVVRVVDAETNAPIKGAFVYAYDYNAFDPFAKSGVFKTDSNGEVFVGKDYRNLVAGAGKTGYNYLSDCGLSRRSGDKLVTTLKLNRDNHSERREAKIEAFKPLPTDAQSASIVSEMRRYFSSRNTIMVTLGEPYIVEVKIRVLDAETRAPIADAMAFVRSGSYVSGMYEDVAVSDANGNIRASVNLTAHDLLIDAGKEGYAPTKRFWRDRYEHGVYTILLSKKGSASSIVLRDTTEFSRSKTNIRTWERFKKYYTSKGGTFKYLREVR